ncbi:GumC family protein [Phreatobacter sp. AB_2022a]|uniref:GumC family protein n=1 Tax=Phreatobacter sp. AB_2022a TaxID=3003134 RepID=UPI00228721C7|nr:exopolysaccharide transport family protein [Phreatobacter sp. AB_2022a]MCZ0735445.1 exopolysaccharide transport family protein [Phreatobacter sp. AB_2022a]
MRGFGGHKRPAEEGAAPRGELDLAALGRAIWARRLWVVVPSALALAGSLVAVNLTTPTYRSEARILVESGDNAYTRSEGDRGSADRATIDQEAVQSQVQVVMSRDIERAVAGELDLAKRPEFDPVLRGINPVKQVLILLGLAENPLRMTTDERVMRSYFEKLTAYQVDKSRIIAVQFESHDPQLATDAANAVAERFLDAQRANKRAQARSASQWLATEIDGLRGKVEEAEARVESFRARANLFVGANNTSLTAQQLAEVNSQIATAKAQQTDAQTRARLLRDFLRAGRPIESGDVVNSEIMRRLNEQRASVQVALAEQASTLGPRHPRMAELRAQLAGLDGQIRTEAEKLVRVLENDARLAGARVEALSQTLDQVKRQASQASEQEVQLRVLEREAKSQRDQLEALLARYRDATTRDSVNAAPPDARIISRAAISSVPAYPKKLPTMLIATLGTMLLALGCVATGALLNGEGQRTAGAEDPEQDLAEPETPLRADIRIEAPGAAPVHASRRAADPGHITAAPIMAAAMPAASAEAAAPSDGARPQAGDPAGGIDSDSSAFEHDLAEDLAGTEAEAEAEVQTTDGEPVQSISGLAARLDATGQPVRRSLVMATAPGLAATGVTLALARQFANGGRRVVMIDLDEGNAALSALAGHGAPGLADLLGERTSFAEIIHRDPASRAHLVPLGQRLPGGPAVTDDERLSFAVGALTRTYDVVLILVGQLAADGPGFERVAAFASDAVIIGHSTAEDPAVLAAYAAAEAARLNPITVMLAVAEAAVAAA